MNQEKIGKFISDNRKKQNLTQEQLAEKLGVSINAVSKWERGLNLPDVSLMLDLCNLLKISLNELFAGEKIKDENYKEIADKNLITALENSSFTLKEKIKFYKKKWLRDHVSEIVINIILWAIIISVMYIYNIIEFDGIVIIGEISLVVIYLELRNKMMRYVENHAYKK